MNATNYGERGAGGGDFYAMVRTSKGKHKSPSKAAGAKLNVPGDMSVSMRSSSGMQMAHMQGQLSDYGDQYEE